MLRNDKETGKRRKKRCSETQAHKNKQTKAAPDILNLKWVSSTQLLLFRIIISTVTLLNPNLKNCQKIADSCKIVLQLQNILCKFLSKFERAFVASVIEQAPWQRRKCTKRVCLTFRHKNSLRSRWNTLLSVNLMFSHLLPFWYSLSFSLSLLQVVVFFCQRVYLEEERVYTRRECCTMC